MGKYRMVNMERVYMYYRYIIEWIGHLSTGGSFYHIKEVGIADCLHLTIL